MKNLIQRFIREEEGQDLAEYALLLALIVVVTAGVVTALATQIGLNFGAATTAITP